MRKSIKLSALAAALLIGSMPLNAANEADNDIIVATDNQSLEPKSVIIQTEPDLISLIESDDSLLNDEADSDIVIIAQTEPSLVLPESDKDDDGLLNNEADSDIADEQPLEPKSVIIQTEPSLVSLPEEEGDKDDSNALNSPFADNVKAPLIYPSAYSLQLPNNGLIWISEDPNMGETSLNAVSLSFVSAENGQLSESLDFYIRTNYAAFIDKLEISIYRSADKDFIEPLAVLNANPTSFTRIRWDGKLPDKYTYQAGDELVYVLRAYDKDGRFDETTAKTISILRKEDVKEAKDELRVRISKEQGILIDDNEAAVMQYLLNEAFGRNAISKRNIVTYGSKIILRGVNIPKDTVLLINSEQYPIDFERRFTAEYIMPVGTHSYDIALIGAENTQGRLSLEVSPYYMFGMAIADITISKSDVGDSELRGDDDEDVLEEGRLAFYTKGKLYGKYNFTAQADTTQKSINKLFSGFTQADAGDLFETLDPDMYYPTYGDDSTVFKDVNTQGRFYAKVEWDKSEALWGNYDTGFSGTEYAAYSRSLYGAKLDYKSLDITPYGESKLNVKLFGSEEVSALGHNEFLGTGGSLYYLQHMDILPGSEKISLRVTDTLTGNTIAKIDLNNGIDYEIDNIQGRVILTRPLSQIIYQNVNTITITSPLSGYEQRLIVDYEYVPRGFEGDTLTGGVRAKQWLNDYIAVGGTYVREEKGGYSDDYQIAGGDITLQVGKGTYIRGEITRTESNAGSIFYSDNGGLSFTDIRDNSNATGGNAISVDARANFKELGIVNNEFTMGGWYRDTQSGFATTASTLAFGGITEYGAEAAAEITNSISIYTKVSESKKKSDDSSYSEAAVKASYKAAEKLTLSAEADYRQTERNATSKVHGAVGALRADYDITPNLETYLTGQFMINDNSGQYENNDAVIVGARYILNGSSLEGRYITGHRGESLGLDVSHELNKDHTVYAGYTYSAEGYSSDNIFNSQTGTGFTVGQKWSVTDKINLYNESQLLRNGNSRGNSNSLGMDFYLGEGWNMGFLYQQGALESSGGETTDRDAFSFSVGQTSSVTNWLSKLEYRQDRGHEEREQFLTTNRISYKWNDSLSFAGKFNYAKTKDDKNAQNQAEFTELNTGFAYRPFDSGKLAFFGRFTYLYDMSPEQQIDYTSLSGSSYDQKSQIISLEGVYKYDAKWEFALKYAQRFGKVKYDGLEEWFDSETTFYAGQVRYDLIYDWHALVEYRVLDVKDGGNKEGYMVGIDKDITKNFRLGIGYNFTDFSDDLRVLDYKSQGWFLNAVGTY
ncbi:MAG: hypothetical protein LBF71_00910 [Campylobacteraceae bacterium]|jgi:hypothetical protein|nr:hypothetical protein [Campylobacteraceae bacterium]